MLSVATDNNVFTYQCQSWKVKHFIANGVVNKNTQSAYENVVTRLALWCHSEAKVMTPAYIDNELLHQYVSLLRSNYAISSVRQHIAGIRTYFTWLCENQFLTHNPAQFITTPVMEDPEMYHSEISNADVRTLLDSVSSDDITALRDRAIIAFIIYTFSTTSIVSACRKAAYVRKVNNIHISIENRRGDVVIIPAHLELVQCMEQYLTCLTKSHDSERTLFVNTASLGEASHNRLDRTAITKVVQRRAEQAGLPCPISPQALRSRAIMNYLSNGGSMEKLKIITCIGSRALKKYDSSQGELRPEDIALVQF